MLPKALEGLNYSTSYLMATMGPTSEHTRSITVRFKDLSRATYDITWKNNSTATAAVHAKDFLPSPIEHRIPSKQDLVTYSEQFGDHIASWCTHREGQQVGSGECWDLAHQALQKACGKHAFVSTYHHHGYPILELRTGSIYKGPEDEVRRGDILQFKAAKFEDRATGSTQTAGAPDHTAVVTGKMGMRVLVAEQNVQGARTVRKGEYVLGNLTAGSVVVYRAMPVAWAE